MRALLLAVVACALVPAQAAAQDLVGVSGILGGDGPPVSDVRTTTLAAALTGDVVLTFRSDPATCAAVGRCGLDGVVVLHPSRDSRLSFARYRQNGRTRIQASATELESDVAQRFQVRREVGVGGARTCAGVAEDSTSTFDVSATAERLEVRVRPEALTAGACSGPLAGDLREAVPDVAVPFAALRRGRRVLDLRDRRTFAAAGLTGAIESTLRVRLGRARVARDDTGDGADEDGGEPTVRGSRWRVARVSGTLAADVRADAAGERCEALDACGATATYTLRPRPRAGGGGFATISPAEDGLDLVGSLAWEERGTLEHVHRHPEGTAPCTDAAALRTVGIIQVLGPRGAPARAALTVPGLRTRCPGPDLAGDVFVFDGLVNGTVSRSALRRSRLVLRFTRPESRREGPYAVQVRPDLTVELRKVR